MSHQPHQEETVGGWISFVQPPTVVGKTVTVVTGFVGISQPEKARLAKEMQKTCGAGGTMKEGRIEIQGDHRDTVARILSNAGFRPVFAGG